MTTWPNGARAATAFTFDFDAEEVWIADDPANANRPGVLSQGTYGAKVAVPLILEVLARQEVSATFFVPGRVAERYPAPGARDPRRRSRGRAPRLHPHLAGRAVAVRPRRLSSSVRWRCCGPSAPIRSAIARRPGSSRPTTIGLLGARLCLLLELHGRHPPLPPSRRRDRGAAGPVDPRRRAPLLVLGRADWNANDRDRLGGARDLDRRARRHRQAGRVLHLHDAPAGNRAPAPNRVPGANSSPRCGAVATSGSQPALRSPRQSHRSQTIALDQLPHVADGARSPSSRLGV